MRRADRLIALTELLQETRAVTAAQLASRLEMSVRTVYRDTAALQGLGVPVDGEAGTGYLLRAPVRLTPLSLTHEQLDALALGPAYVEQVGDPDLQKAAREAGTKIDQLWNGSVTSRVLPDQAMRAGQRPERRAPPWAGLLRDAIRRSVRVSFSHVGATGEATRRVVRPLALSACSEGWLLIGWCELRQQHRTFRLDRIRDYERSEGRFDAELEPWTNLLLADTDAGR